MSIRLYRESDRSRWDAFVAKTNGSHAYHQAGWASVIERSFGQRPYYLLSEGSNGEVNGVLPLARLKSRMFGDFLVSLPYLNYGGPCAINRSIERELIDEAIRIGRAEGVDYLELRLSAEEQLGLKVKASKVSMRLPLGGDAGALWKSFSSKLRNQIGKPMKEDMEVRFGNVEELDAFHDVFSVNMRDVGTPVYGKSFFRHVLQEFPDTAKICNVYHQGQPVASGFVIGFGGVLEIPWASSLRSANRLSPNMLLYWSVLKHACESGYEVFDFGRSTPGGGTYKFKEQWGAKPLPLFWHYWMPGDAAMPELNPANPKYQMAINVWKRLPVGLTRLIGPAIVRSIP